MYYPIQLPYILDSSFSEAVKYTEEIIAEYTRYIICLWEINSRNSLIGEVNNIIVMDGCIDLVIDFDHKVVGFSGMKKTEFNFKISLPCNYFGLRLMPGVFYQLTNIEATKAMDSFILIENVFEDFDIGLFKKLDYEKAKVYVVEFIKRKLGDLDTDIYTSMFSDITENPSINVDDVYNMFNLKPRQCQRIFQRYYGLSPKQVLSIVRFQYCIKVLISNDSKPTDILDVFYYDQSHYINDFKSNIGLSPFDFVNMYKDGVFFQ